MTYNVWNKWGKLKTMMVGTCHEPEFFDFITDPRVKGPLTRILEETLEDLEGFQKTLESFGVNVIRPKTLYKQSVKELNGAVPRSSLQPRDCQLVIGNKLVYTSSDNQGIINALRDYNKKDIIIDPMMFSLKDIDKNIAEYTGNEFLRGAYWNAPCATVVGNRVYTDVKEISPVRQAYLKKMFPDMKFIDVTIGGHNDGCFQTLKPGVIMSLRDITNYEENFPGWDVLYLEDQSWNDPALKDYEKIKNATKGKWWIPGEEENTPLIHFVNEYLDKWVGYVEETVFDVNTIMIDENHCCVYNKKPNEKVSAFFKKHKIEPVYVQWRHRYFWDGGLHCITLDLEREGEMEDYFA